LKLDANTIIKDEYTAKEVAAIFAQLGLLHKSPLAWLNWLKNSHKMFEPRGETRSRKVWDHKKFKELKISKYTFADVCLAIWVRSVASGNIRQNKKGGIAILHKDIVKLAPDVLKQIKTIEKKYDKALMFVEYPYYIAGSIFTWNQLSVNCLYLAESVVNSIMALQKRGVIKRQ